MTNDLTMLERLVSTLGVPVAILLVTGIAAWKMGKFLGKQFFDLETGLFQRVVSTHIEFVNEVEKSVKNQEAQSERQTAVIEELRDVLVESHEANS